VMKREGRHEDLDLVLARRARWEASVRPPRYSRSGVLETVPEDTAEYWEEKVRVAGHEILRDLDGGKVYTHRQAAYRRCKQLNDQWMDDWKENAREYEETQKFLEEAYQAARIERVEKEEEEYRKWREQRYLQRMAEREQEAALPPARQYSTCAEEVDCLLGWEMENRYPAVFEGRYIRKEGNGQLVGLYPKQGTLILTSTFRTTGGVGGRYELHLPEGGGMRKFEVFEPEFGSASIGEIEAES
jgi:hypothetical protein